MRTFGTPQIRVWDVRTGRLLRTLPLDELVYDLAFSPDGTFLAARQAGKVRIFDPSSDWMEAQVLKMHYGINAARVHLGAGNRVIVSDAEGFYRDGVAGIRVWYPDGKLKHLLRTNGDFVPLALSHSWVIYGRGSDRGNRYGSGNRKRRSECSFVGGQSRWQHAKTLPN